MWVVPLFYISRWPQRDTFLLVVTVWCSSPTFRIKAPLGHPLGLVLLLLLLPSYVTSTFNLLLVGSIESNLHISHRNHWHLDSALFSHCFAWHLYLSSTNPSAHIELEWSLLILLLLLPLFQPPTKLIAFFWCFVWKRSQVVYNNSLYEYNFN